MRRRKRCKKCGADVGSPDFSLCGACCRKEATLPFAEWPNRVPPAGHVDAQAEDHWEQCGGDVDKFLDECGRKHQ